MEIDKTWLVVGLIGQALFSARFVVQWLYSEKVKKSVIPTAFWYFSVGGGATRGPGRGGSGSRRRYREPDPHGH